MSIGAEIWLTCLREVRRNLRSKKGLAATAFYSMGGVAFAFVLGALRGYAVESSRGRSPEEAMQVAYRAAIESLYEGNDAAIRYLSAAPSGLVGYYFISLLFIPLLVILLGYDSISGDHQGKTLRFFTPRARRSSLIFGRGLALWLSVSAVTLVPTVIAWILFVARGNVAVADIAYYGPRIWLMSCVYSFAYVGLTVLLSTLSAIPTIALFSAAGVSLGLWIFRKVAATQNLPYQLTKLTFLLPGTWEHLLLSPAPTDFLKAFTATMAFGGVCLGMAAAILEDRDV